MMKTTRSTHRTASRNRRMAFAAVGITLSALIATPVVLSLSPALLAPAVFGSAAILLAGVALQSSQPAASFRYRRSTGAV